MPNLQLKFSRVAQKVTVFYREKPLDLFKPLLTLSPIEAHRFASQLRLNADECYIDSIQAGLIQEKVLDIHVTGWRKDTSGGSTTPESADGQSNVASGSKG